MLNEEIESLKNREVNLKNQIKVLQNHLDSVRMPPLASGEEEKMQIEFQQQQ